MQGSYNHPQGMESMGKELYLLKFVLVPFLHFNITEDLFGTKG